MIYITKYFDGLLNAIKFCSDLRLAGGACINKGDSLPPESTSHLAIEKGELVFCLMTTDIYGEYKEISTAEFLSLCEKEFPKKPELEKDPDGNEPVISETRRLFDFKAVGYRVVTNDKNNTQLWASKPMPTEEEAAKEWNRVMRAYHDREARDRR